ncbi:hypothetical protein FKP32DRAFT_1625776 [Trametes sanguinea]|nr:hypothetical protein FKP32DRAFT_1625776 [Trametes sanguinea]
MVFTPSSSPRVCIYHSLGRCTKGDQCRFYHPPIAKTSQTVEPEPANPSLSTKCRGGTPPLCGLLSVGTPACEFHQRGYCRFGERCRLRHSSSGTITPAPLYAPLNIADEPKKSIPLESKLSPSAPSFRPSSSASREEAGLSRGKASTFGPCKFFAQNRCTKGSECPFPHIKDFRTIGAEISSPATQPAQLRLARTHSRIQPPIEHNDITTSNPPPCKYFLKGSCQKGVTCSFYHPAGRTTEVPGTPVVMSKPADPQAPQEPSTAQPPAKREISAQQPENASHREQSLQEPGVVTRSKLGCKVMYGPGAAVESITTSFESTCIILHNVPPRTTQADLITLGEPFGELKSVMLYPSRDSTTEVSARIEYLSTDDAARAVQTIAKNASLRGANARLDLRAAESGTAVLRSTKVKLSWFAPSLIAWAHYRVLSKAKSEAARLDGTAFDGRTIRASFQTPSWRQTTSFSVEIKGLPLDASSDRLKRFCNASSVTIGEPSFTTNRSVDRLRALLSEKGPLESFELMHADVPANKPKLVAFAQFHDPDAAMKAVSELNSTRQPFLRSSQIFLELIHSVKYMMPYAQFSILRGNLEALRGALQSFKLRFHDKDEQGRAAERVCVRAYGSDAKALMRLKTELESIMRGHVVHDADGEVLWHEYFATTSGRAFLDAVSSTTQTFIRPDGRTRTVHVFGTQVGRAAAMASLLEQADQLEAEQHIIDLDEEMFRRMLHGGFSTLQSSLGETIFLDVVKRRLIVRGDDLDVRGARSAVVQLRTEEPMQTAVTSPADTPCPICFCDVEDPLMLSCGHVYCRPCLQHYLGSLAQATAGGGSTTATCLAKGTVETAASDVGGDCKCAVPLEIVRSLLSPGEEERLLETTFLSHIHSRPQQFKYCPTADCQTVYRAAKEGTLLRCPSCLTRICAFCHVEAHEGLTCAEYKDHISGGDDSFRRWAEAHGARPCPGCGAHLEKNGGCNHMTCAHCGAHMCWVCMRVFQETDSGGGVYAHMQREHGGIM